MHKALIIKHYRSFFFYIKPAFYRELEHLIQVKSGDVEALLTFVGLQRKEKVLKSKNINQ